MKVITHPWINGDDDSAKPMVTLLDNGHWLIKSDGSTDADGSPRVGQIDPKSGQSRTSLGKPTWKGPNDYVDSEKIPFFVLPLNWAEVTGTKCKLGDMARLSYKDKSIYAIFADEGPREIIGEASVFAIEALGGNPWNSAKTKIVSGLPFGVSYEVIPNSSNLARTVSYETIQAYGKELFENAKNPEIPSDYSLKFDHLKNVKNDLLLSLEDSENLWSAMLAQASDKIAFNARVVIGVQPSYGNAQCATTTASVIEGACLKAGLTNTASIFSDSERKADHFALTHQIEIMLKRLGFAMYSKKDFFAPRGAICMMAGRYSFAGCKQHSGHVFTMNTDKGADAKDIINDNGGFEHQYNELTESFFLPRGIEARSRSGVPVPTPEPKPIPTTSDKVTWFELNRSKEGKPAVTAYIGATPLFTRFWKDKEDLINFLDAFENANSVLVAETDKKVIPEMPDFAEEDPGAPKLPPVTDNADKFVTFFRNNYGLVRKEVERWFAGVYSDSAVHNGCVAHQVSALKLAGLPYPKLGSMESINVDYFVTWALANKWTKVVVMDQMKPGDICVSGPSTTDWDHVYCFVSYINNDNAYVLHNQVTGLAKRSLIGQGCGKWRFALRIG